MSTTAPVPPIPPVLQVPWGEGVRAFFTLRGEPELAAEGSRGAPEPGNPCAGLNLGAHVGDDPVAVAANRLRVQELIQAPVQYVNQVHGTEVHVVQHPRDVTTSAERPDPSVDLLGPTADAVVTGSPEVGVAVLVADCVPVLLHDPITGVCAAAHAGRVGLLNGVLQATVAAMTELGAEPGTIQAAIGPCAGPCCYEVPADLREQAQAALPQTWGTTTWGTPSLDLPAGARAALAQAGVVEVFSAEVCTITDERFFSYRRAPGGITGRFAGVIRCLE